MLAHARPLHAFLYALLSLSAPLSLPLLLEIARRARSGHFLFPFVRGLELVGLSQKSAKIV